MRIIPDDAKTYDTERYLRQPAVRISDTIEIADEGWDEIYESYDYPEIWVRRFEHDSKYTFSQYLSELVELARVK